MVSLQAVCGTRVPPACTPGIVLHLERDRL